MAVTIQQVTNLIPTNRDVQPFIEQARLIVSEDLATSGLSTARKDLIELYLAAHFTAVAEERGQLKSVETLNAKDEYAGNFTAGLDLTRFGQQAVVLDTTGILADMATPTKKAQFRVV